MPRNAMGMLAFATLWGCMSEAVVAQTGSITYQGKLGFDGAPVSDTADFQFALWDADAGGNMIGALLAADAVQVVDGLFTVELDFGQNAFGGGDRWLEIAVRSPAGGGAFTTLSPRQAVTAAPYALQTRGIFVDQQGHVGIGTGNPTVPLHVETDSASRAIYGRHTAASGTNPGVYGQSDSTSGRGVYGFASAATGENFGVVGESTSINGRGVLGRAAVGVWGQSDSAPGRGVFGHAIATAGVNYGVFGMTLSTQGRGVYGLAYPTTGTTVGVYGEVRSPDGYAGYFEGGRNYFEGRLGIGTSAPHAQLHVVGGNTILEQEPWQAPSLQNGWVDYGSGYAPSGYFKDSTGVVHLRGLVKSGPVGSLPIFTLPPQYRPAFRAIFPVKTFAADVGRVDVLADGSVIPIDGSSSYVSLEGITFRAEQ